MCYSVCAARPFMDQCIKAGCFEYQTRLWLAPPAPLCRADCTWSLSSPHSNRLPQKCLPPPQHTHTPSRLSTTVVLFNSSPSRPLLAQHAACRGSLGKQRSPRSHMQNLWLQRNTKEERDPVLSHGADIGFQIPHSYTPRHCSAAWRWQKEWGEEEERNRLKCSCRACVYFHPALQSTRVSFLLQLEEGAHSRAQLGRLSSCRVPQRRPS